MADSVPLGGGDEPKQVDSDMGHMFHMWRAYPQKTRLLEEYSQYRHEACEVPALRSFRLS